MTILTHTNQIIVKSGIQEFIITKFMCYITIRELEFYYLFSVLSIRHKE